jgi:hypothetical protein
MVDTTHGQIAERERPYRSYMQTLVYLLAATTATLLSACGGGNGSGSAEHLNSEACFNAGFYREGTSINVNYSSRVNNAAAYESNFLHRVTSVNESNGVTSIFVSPDTGRTSIHYSIQNGALLNHGSSSLGIGFGTRVVMAPPLQEVILMEPGQTTSQNIVQTNDLNKPDSSTRTTLKIAYTRTYVGRQKVSTHLGRFDTCQFVVRNHIEDIDNASDNRDKESISWVAAEGPYRGLTLKTETSTRTQTGILTTASEATSVAQFDIK